MSKAQVLYDAMFIFVALSTTAQCSESDRSGSQLKAVHSPTATNRRGLHLSLSMPILRFVFCYLLRRSACALRDLLSVA